MKKIRDFFKPLEQMRKEIGCKHFVSGTMEITPEGRPTRILGYGEGDCNNIATVTLNGFSFEIQLR